MFYQFTVAGYLCIRKKLSMFFFGVVLDLAHGLFDLRKQC